MLARMSLPRGQLTVDRADATHPCRGHVAPNGRAMCALKSPSSSRGSDAGNLSKSAITSIQEEV